MCFSGFNKAVVLVGSWCVLRVLTRQYLCLGFDIAVFQRFCPWGHTLGLS